MDPASVTGTLPSENDFSPSIGTSGRRRRTCNYDRGYYNMDGVTSGWQSGTCPSCGSAQTIPAFACDSDYYVLGHGDSLVSSVSTTAAITCSRTIQGAGVMYDYIYKWTATIGQTTGEVLMVG